MTDRSKIFGLYGTIFLTAAIFIYDTYTPIGSADYIFYFFPVVTTMFQGNRKLPLWVALITTALSYVGFIFSPPSNAVLEIAINNRIKAGSAIWVCAALVYQIIKIRTLQEKADWVRSGLNRLSESLRGEHSPEEIATRFLEFLRTYTSARIGAVHLADEKEISLSFLSGLAYSGDKKDIPFGEGLIGQTAKDKKFELLSPVPEGYLKFASAFGEGTPKHIAFLPLQADNRTIGVAEVGYEHELSPETQELLKLTLEAGGIALLSSVNKETLAKLLAEAQAMTEELQAQQEELRVVNEELEQQSRALKESHTKLENQQAELEQTNQQLEEQAQVLENQSQALNEANRELSNKQADLEEKATELEKSSKYKSEFLANMSHELRTPLNSSLILAKLLSDNKPGNLTEEQINYANVIYSSGNDLLNLINDILDLSKVEAGKLNVTPENFAIEGLKTGLENLFAPLATQKKLNFRVTVDPKAPSTIYSDRMRLEQILKNLLSNAIKFTERGEVELQILKNGHDVEFRVRDTGTGIRKEEQEIIFEAFRQADGTTNRKFGGTGLGLSISRELARLLGGHITIKSEHGKGSTFTLHLPEKFSYEKEDPVIVTRQNQTRIPETRKSEPEVRFSFTDDRELMKEGKTKDRKILIIEDDEAFAKILLDLAREMNFLALVTPTADEGMRLAREFIPDAIILDIRLPDHSGLLVLDQVKANPRTRHIPVHVVSSTDYAQSAREMGAVGYAMKPVKRDTLKVVFQNITSLVTQKKKTVLVVEDDEIQKKHITDLISDQNVTVVAVTTVREALGKLKDSTFDCMIMDLSLPDSTGYELLEKLSENSSPYSFPPVIVYTARDLTREEEEKLRAYSASIIIKGAKSPERLLNEVTLFLHRIESDLPPERQKMLKELRSREKTLHERNILIVDDDVRNIFALTSALENCGARIIVARNGRESLEQLVAHPETDLVLMDIMMPEMDGYEAITRMRADEKNKNLPIIALTAKTMKDDQVKCLSVGANDYLPKPLDVDKLLSLVRVWLPVKRNFFT